MADSSLQALITAQASAAGIPPAIALGVAQVESGTAQYTSGGSLVKSPAGAIGVFQLMQNTADGLGVDPTDTESNIQGGIAYLAQMYQQFGDWPTAIAAYNAGPGRVASSVASGAPLPAETQAYVPAVLAAAGNYGATASPASSDSAPAPVAFSLDPTALLSSLVPGMPSWGWLLALAGIGFLVWEFAD